MWPTCILRPTTVIITGAELKIKVCSVIKKEKQNKTKQNNTKKKKEKKRTTKKISTRFVISTNNLIMLSYSTKKHVRLLKKMMPTI